MLKLYFSKGSSALAAHIVLEETGVPFEAQEVSIPRGQHLETAFLRLNPKGRLPLLHTPEGLLTENPAILEYIAATHPDAQLMPSGAFDQAQARALCAYLCATVHVAFAHKQRGARWAQTAQALADMAQLVPQNLTQCAAHLEQHTSLAPWALGPRYSFCDAYLFLIGRWMGANGLDLAAYPKLAAHGAAMRARPATQAALKAHGLG